MVVQGKPTSDVALAVVYARTGKELEYTALKFGDSHLRILPIRLNAAK